MTLWIRCLITIAAGAFFSAVPLLCAAQNLYDSAHIHQYAAHLYASRQYGKAAEEYKRLLTFPKQGDIVVNNLLESWQKSGLNDSGISFIKRYYPGVKDAPPFVPCYLEKYLILSGRYEEADRVYDSFRTMPVDYRFYIYALQGKWKAMPDSCLRQVRNTSPNRIKWDALMERQNHLKYKNPALALTLSTIVPGAGKIYGGDWKDGVVSMLLIGSMAYESYTGFQTRGTSSVLGWVFGGLAVGYYGGNIYGAWHSALRYNARLDKDIYDEAYKLTVSDFLPD